MTRRSDSMTSSAARLSACSRAIQADPTPNVLCLTCCAIAIVVAEPRAARRAAVADPHLAAARRPLMVDVTLAVDEPRVHRPACSVSGC